MRTIEIILKLTFLALSIFVIVTKNATGNAFTSLAIVAFLLGLTLIFNKKQSYKYPANSRKLDRVFVLRRIEGTLLIVVSLFVLVLCLGLISH